VAAARNALVHLPDHAACGGLEQAGDDGVHQGRQCGAEQAGREAEREQEMLAIGFIDTLRVGQEQPKRGWPPCLGDSDQE
jgi:hypothetical protein